MLTIYTVFSNLAPSIYIGVQFKFSLNVCMNTALHFFLPSAFYFYRQVFPFAKFIWNGLVILIIVCTLHLYYCNYFTDYLPKDSLVSSADNNFCFPSLLPLMYVQGGYSSTITSLLLSSAVPQCARPQAAVFPNRIIPFRPKGKWKIWAVFFKKSLYSRFP